MDNTFAVPNLNPEFTSSIDMEKINKFLATRVMQCRNEENFDEGKLEVVISISEDGLTPDEIRVAEGIVMINGYKWYEIL